MVIKLIKDMGTIYDISNACTRITWKGSASEASRSVDFDYINAPYDNTVNLPSIATGDYISLEDSKEGEIFFGQIFGVEKSSQTGTITFTAYDMMKHLLESTGQYNFKNLTAEAITSQVCADIQVPIRHLHPTGVNIASMICDKMKMYDIVMAAYTKAHKITGDKYFAMIYKRGLGVYKTEWAVKGFILSESTNIYASSISERMDDIKNKILIFDDKGKQIGEVKDDGSIKKFGIFQEIYTKEEGIDATTGAKNLLKIKPTQAIKISAIGDINCLSCYFVQVKDAATGLSGKYWISSDSHIFENGTHKMELELKFDSLMDTKDIKEETEKKEEKKESKKESKGKAEKSKGTPAKKKSKQKEVLESVKKAVKEQQAPKVPKTAKPERKKYTGMME
jgi:cell wall-associated hydrolases (invasion-associated proteins)|nr:MAG TPA: 43 kDa tail protein [Caudoviricetes sp.]